MKSSKMSKGRNASKMLGTTGVLAWLKQHVTGKGSNNNILKLLLLMQQHIGWRFGRV